MKIKNPLQAKNFTLGKIFLIVWFLFATAFVLNAGWSTIENVVFRQGVQRGALLGQNESITKIIQLSQNCNIVSLFAGEGEARVEIGLVDATCTPEQVQAVIEAANGVVETEEVVAPVTEEEGEAVLLEE